MSLLPICEQDYFNPRSLAGATLITPLFILFVLFQSTLPCGSDSRRPGIGAGWFEFQSTLPCGSDLLAPMVAVMASVFQSTLPCGSDYVGSRK